MEREVDSRIGKIVCMTGLTSPRKNSSSSTAQPFRPLRHIHHRDNIISDLQTPSEAPPSLQQQYPEQDMFSKHPFPSSASTQPRQSVQSFNRILLQTHCGEVGPMVSGVWLFFAVWCFNILRIWRTSPALALKLCFNDQQTDLKIEQKPESWHTLQFCQMWSHLKTRENKLLSVSEPFLHAKNMTIPFFCPHWQLCKFDSV